MLMRVVVVVDTLCRAGGRQQRADLQLRRPRGPAGRPPGDADSGSWGRPVVRGIYHSASGPRENTAVESSTMGGLMATFTLREGHYVLKTQKLTW